MQNSAQNTPSRIQPIKFLRGLAVAGTILTSHAALVRTEQEIITAEKPTGRIALVIENIKSRVAFAKVHSAKSTETYGDEFLGADSWVNPEYFTNIDRA